MAKKNRPSVQKHEREQRKRDRERRKAEKAAQKQDRRAAGSRQDAGAVPENNERPTEDV